MKLDFSDTSVIITGSSGGVGSALVTALRSHHATVVGIDVVPPTATQPDTFIEGDIRDARTIDAALTQIVTGRWAFVPAATVGAQGDVAVDDVLTTNFHAAFGNARQIIERTARPGTVLFLGSIAAYRHDHDEEWCVTGDFQLVSRGGRASAAMAYGLSKWALARAAMQLAAATASSGVRVNYLVLGPTETLAASRIAAEQPERWQTLLAEMPFGGPNRIADVVEPLVFLLSPIADRITGSTICIDGGWTVCRRSPIE